MHSILPLNEIRSAFDKAVLLQQYGNSDLEKIQAINLHSISGTCLNVWNRIVVAGTPKVYKYALAPYIDEQGIGKAGMLQAMNKIIGQPVIQDISWSRCTIDDPTLEDKVVAQLVVARVFPNDLHLVDVHFRNPYKPIPEAKQKYHFRDYEGLGLLPTVMARLEEYARSHSCDYLTLTCAHADLAPLFGKFGFTVETNPLGRMAHAMEKKVLQAATVQ